MAEHEDLVAAYVDLVEAEWVRADLSARERRRLCAELERDLLAALAAGAPVAEVFAVDATTLARDIADAEGLSVVAAPPPLVVSRGGLIARGLAGAVGMTAVAWFLVIPSLGNALYNDSSPAAEAISLVLLYGVCGALVLGGAAVAMARYLQYVDGWRSITVRATVAMGVLGALGIPPCMGIGALSNYSSDPVVVLLYLLIVGGLAAAGIALAWRWGRAGELAFE